MIRSTDLASFLFISTIVISQLAFAANGEKEPILEPQNPSARTACGETMGGLIHPLGSKELEEQGRVVEMLFKLQDQSADHISKILGETHALNELLIADPAKNLTKRSPFIFMNAPQRITALVLSQGKSTVRDRVTGEEIDYYPFFSAGLPATKGRRIIGNEKAIAALVNNLKTQASGSRSGSSVVAFVGGSGTGKTELLKVIAEGAEVLTSEDDPRFAVYSFAWKNLDQIPSLHRFIPAYEVDGKKVFPPLDAPLGDSPFTILPPAYQDLLLSHYSNEAERLTGGMKTIPWPEPDPASAFIRNEIIQHYARVRGHALSANEIVEILNSFVVVKRQILSEKQGHMPLIDVQGDEIDVGGLFMSENPVVRFAAGVGPTHPMAWYFNGKFALGHGSAVLVDEFFRNSEVFRNLVLGAFESGTIANTGGPSFRFNSVIVVATNTSSVEKVLADGKPRGGGKTSTAAAALDRLRTEPMRWSVDPSEIGKLLLNSNSVGLLQQPLLEDGLAPTVPGNLDELFPRGERFQKSLTPDGRYRIWFGGGSSKVYLAPHTLMTMAEIIAASRVETSPERAAGVYFKGKIVHSNIFRNPIDRIRFWEGLKPDVPQEELNELARVTMLLKEGESGISARDANKWLAECITAAASEKTGWTLTPGVMLKKFRDLLDQRTIQAPSEKVRAEWVDLATEVTNQLLIPRIESDISRALANGDQVVNRAYFEILDEMYALSQNPNATMYESNQNNQTYPIDRDRLEKIKAIYLQKTGRALNIDQIAMFHSRQKSVGGAARVPEEQLHEAVSQYFASLHEQVSGFSSLVDYERTGTGTDEVKAAHSSMVSALTAMGYNRVAIRDALMLIKMQRSLTQAQAQ